MALILSRQIVEEELCFYTRDIVIDVRAKRQTVFSGCVQFVEHTCTLTSGDQAPHSSPSPLFSPSLLWPNGRPSQQLLSSC